MELGLCCPVETLGPGPALPEVRAYKLGKKRWSYNQVELLLTEAEPKLEEGGTPTAGGRLLRRAVVQQAVHCAAKFAEAHQDSAVGFVIQLESGVKLQAHVYLCYDGPPADTAAASSGSSAATACSGSGRGPSPVPGSSLYSWNLVTRQHCCKGCEGRVLRSIQRFGRVGKRAGSGDARGAGVADLDAAPLPSPGPATGMKKDPRFMYLSLDEACTHVDAAAFRLVTAIYSRTGGKLLATAVSPPIRVLANNDVPTGAARITLEAQLPADWEGWAAEAACPPASPPKPLPQPPSPPKQQPSTPSTRRKAAAKPRQGIRAAAPGDLSPHGSFADGGDLAFALSTPNVKEGLQLSRAAASATRPLSARQRQRQQQQQQQAATEQQQQQQQQDEALYCGEPWQLPLHALVSPLRRDTAHLLPRTISMPAAVTAYFESAGSGAEAVACSSEQQEQQQQQPGSARRLRRRLSMPGSISGFKFELEASPPLTQQHSHDAGTTFCGLEVHHAPPQWLAPACAEPAPPAGPSTAGRNDLVAHIEAERQLRLLQNLKAQILAASNEAASSGSGCCPPPPPPLPLPIPLPSAAAHHHHHHHHHHGRKAAAAAAAGGAHSHLGCPAPAPSGSLLGPNASDTSLPAEDSGLMLDNLGLPLALDTEDDDSGLHMALMDHAGHSGVEMLDISSLFDDDAMLRS